MWIIKFLLLCLCFEYIAGGNSNARTIFPPEDDESSKPKIPVCCPFGFFISDSQCSRITKESNHTIKIPEVFTNTLTLSSKFLEDFDRIYRIPCEHGFSLRTQDDREIWYLLGNGSIFMNNSELLNEYNETIPDKMLTIDDYCWANVINENESDAVIAECLPEIIIYPTTMILALPFLIATFFVYAFLPELRNIYGMSLMTHIASTFSAYVALILVQLKVANVWITFNYCIFTAFVMQFSFLSSFFWLNIMCFDIWWTFGVFRLLRGSAKSRERRKFIIYSVYAWGCPSIITGMCLIMQFAPGIPDNYYKPDFGMSSCSFGDDYARVIFFEGPIGITVLCNVYFFVSTALKIRKQKKDTAYQLRGINSRRHDHQKNKFSLYLKLFTVMGITWSVEIFLWLWQVSLPYLWLVTDLAHTIQGMIIFIIFVCKEDDFSAKNTLMISIFVFWFLRFVVIISMISTYPLGVLNTSTRGPHTHRGSFVKLTALETGKSETNHSILSSLSSLAFIISWWFVASRISPNITDFLCSNYNKEYEYFPSVFLKCYIETM